MGHKARRDSAVLQISNGVIDPNLAEEISRSFPELLRPMVTDFLESNASNCLHHGNLRLADFDATDCQILVVEGDLQIDGCYRDYHHPETLISVTGSVYARNMVTSGSLFVAGNLEVIGSLVGDRNSCAAEVGGNLVARFFYPENHHFTVHGKIDVSCAVGSYHRLKCPQGSRELFLSDAFGIVPRENMETVLAHLGEQYVMRADDVLYLFEGGSRSFREFCEDLRCSTATLASECSSKDPKASKVCGDY